MHAKPTSSRMRLMWAGLEGVNEPPTMLLSNRQTGVAGDAGAMEFLIGWMQALSSGRQIWA